TGGFGFFANEKYDRTVYKADLSTFLSTHEIKFGGDMEDLKGDLQNYQGGAGQLIYKLPGRTSSNGQPYYRHRMYLNDLKPGFSRTDPSTWEIAFPQIADPQTKNTSAYVQDSWRLMPNLTVLAGVRWEKQQV